MSQIKCTKCGEMFSDSYKTCPFCAEDEEYYNGKVKKRGHRQMEKKKKAPSIIGPALVLVLVLLAAVLVWFFAGDTIKGWFGGSEQKDPVDDQQQTQVTQPAEDDTDTQEPKELALDHLTLLLAPGESETLEVSGGSDEVYQWITSDSGVAKVSDDGTVTAVAEGTAMITVTCGDESVACAVTVQKKADISTTKPNDNSGTTTTKPSDTTSKPSDSTTTKPNTSTNTSTSLKNLKIKTMYGTELGKNPDGQFDMTVGRNDPPCELTLEGITGTATWKSSNTNVVKVSSDGVIERVGSGTATVTITVGSATAEILVRVN